MILTETYKKTGLTLVLVLALAFTGYSQKMAIRLGDSNFRDFNFITAIEYYEFAYEHDAADAYVIRRLAEANDHIGKSEEVEKWLAILVQKGMAEPSDLYQYVQALKNNGKYTEAEKVMHDYAVLKPNDPRNMMEVSMLEYVQFLMRDSSRYVIRNMAINTAGSDMGPAYYKNQIVFSSTSLSGTTAKRTYGWNKLPYLDMYVAQIAANGDLLSPKPFAPKLKTNFHDGPITYDEKNDRIFYTINNIKRSFNLSGKESTMNLKTNFAKNGKDGWEYDGSFQFNRSDYSVGHPSIDTTGNVIYFASDMPGGYGGTDIYSSTYSDGRWSVPQNLGSKVNSAENEFFPFISYDGILYFASKGHGGMGGLDIFFSVPENGEFNTIENMGYPVNSPRDDFALVLDKTGMQGYFASNRPSGKGNDDIYHLRIARVPVIIRGWVRDQSTAEPIAGAEISLINKAGEVVYVVLSRPDGAFEFELNKGEDYSLLTRKEMFSEKKKTVSTLGLRPNQELLVEILLESAIPEIPIAEEISGTEDNYPVPLSMEEEDGRPVQVLELEYINYDLDKWDIRYDASEVLDRLLAIMLEYPDLEIRLESHTDSRGSDDYNLLLSKRRARSAFEYLIDRGITSDRIQHEGYGETRLLNRCANGVECTEEEHEVNRRTIVKVIRKGEVGRRGQRGIFVF